jgi:hypothetical protein
MVLLRCRTLPARTREWGHPPVPLWMGRCEGAELTVPRQRGRAPSTSLYEGAELTVPRQRGRAPSTSLYELVSAG